MTKVGFIGVRHVHAEGLAGYVTALGHEIVGAHEPDTAAAAGWRASPVLGSVDEVLEQCDAVIVAGTNRERVDGALAATAAGKHVLAEKPVGMNPEEVDRLIARVRGGSGRAQDRTRRVGCHSFHMADRYPTCRGASGQSVPPP